MLHTSLGGEGGEGMFYLCERTSVRLKAREERGRKYRVSGINAQEDWELAARQLLPLLQFPAL